MTNIANITLTDSVAANHVLVPLTNNPFAKWINRDSVTSAGNLQASASLLPAVGNAIKDRVLIKLKRPIEAELNGVTTVVREQEMIVEFKTHKDCTDLENLDFGTMCRDFLGDALIKPYYENREPSF